MTNTVEIFAGYAEANPRPEVPRITPASTGEREPTSSVSQMTWYMCVVSSRWSKADELETMLDMIEALPIQWRRSVARIECDSKAGASYTVVLAGEDAETRREIAARIEQSVKGHNGIWVLGGDAVSLDPNWPEVWGAA